MDFEKLDYSHGPIFFSLSKVLKSVSLENSDNLMTASLHHEFFTSYKKKCTLKSRI